MVDIQSSTAEIRRGKKERKIEAQGINIMACPITQGGHNNNNLMAMFRVPYNHHENSRSAFDEYRLIAG